MNRFVQLNHTLFLLAAFSSAVYAQETTEQQTQIAGDTTRRELREASREASDASREVERGFRNTDNDRDRRRSDRDYDRYRDNDRDRYDRDRSRRTNTDEGGWYGRGGFFGGLNLGFGLADQQGGYIVLNPRLGYFIQNGLAVGLKLAFEDRLSTSYRATQGGPFVRYYPFRTRLAVFGEGGLSLGRYRSSVVDADDRRGFSSINLGIGAALQATRSLDLELMYDHNYYDKTPEFAGRNRGPQIKLGVVYHVMSRRNRN
ncbi:porin family protein [Tellurirhabdus bombi]|uniref:porin family protein n=1 Tax=Tellurirhabdus bombi TaxID=2907205 RepID=UPI001F393CF3|nr:porin family protein [Tellurirhabdus bombi]